MKQYGHNAARQMPAASGSRNQGWRTDARLRTVRRAHVNGQGWAARRYAAVSRVTMPDVCTTDAAYAAAVVTTIREG